MKTLQFSGMVLAGLCLLSALSLPFAFQAPMSAKAALTVGDAKKGAVLYKQNCAICHGETGKGDGLAGKSLQPPPRNFSKGIFKYTKNDAELLKFIQTGKSPMPSWEGTLTEAQIQDVIAFIHSLKQKRRNS